MLDLYFSDMDLDAKALLESIVRKHGMSFSDCICCKNAKKSEILYEMLLLGRTETPFLVSGEDIFEKWEFENIIASMKNGLIN